MELRQLAYVVAVAEEGGFTRAAERVRVAQPAVSQQIARLEREVGDLLFDRTGRRVRLTPAGEAFLPHARAALAAAEAGRDAVAALRGVLVGELRIGTVPAPPPELLERVADFGSHHPQVRLRLLSGDPEALTADVAAGVSDLALIGVSGPRQVAGPAGQRLPAALAYAPFAQEPLVVAVPPGHPLAAAPDVAIAELRGHGIVTLPPVTGLRAELDNACADAGFTPDVVAETDDLAVLPGLAARGLGIALVPRSVAEGSASEVVSVPVRAPAPHRPMALVWHRDRLSAAGRAFLELAPRLDDAGNPDRP
ncbi:LysR family transcriptional regulator [Yinghuangia seranimata]|uniref:LysR family transcriptional regulator n=1 Tax=Yinghuangia seranimata TaxID=408067 RepID=UPI00248D160B|nr:LysR family transcriptional regulator [Yinghuangia seranimata]MDI2127638.1 LysR family transcriptional regulator [Yinghuangia seranimata]